MKKLVIAVLMLLSFSACAVPGTAQKAVATPTPTPVVVSPDDCAKLVAKGIFSATEVPGAFECFAATEQTALVAGGVITSDKTMALYAQKNKLDTIKVQPCQGGYTSYDDTSYLEVWQLTAADGSVALLLVIFNKSDGKVTALGTHGAQTCATA